MVSIGATEYYPSSIKEYRAMGETVYKKDKSKNKYNVYKLEKKILEGPYLLTVNYLYYQTKISVKRELIVLTPTISGVSSLEKTVARYFSKRGYDVIIPIAFETQIEFNEQTVKYMDRGFFRPVAQAKLMIEELRSKNNYEKTFLLGASQGGIRSTMLLGENLNIDKAFTFVAGGDFPKLYAETTVKQLIEFRQKHMAALGITKTSDYEDYLRENLTFDPKQACVKSNVEMKMLIATEDTSVPTETQYDLWKACGEPELIKVKGGHVKGVLKMYWMRKEILNFFKN